jgi:ribosome maturation factor RimP
VEYIPLSETPYYTDCVPVVAGLGYSLVELRVVRHRGSVRVTAVIADRDPSAAIGLGDCARVHRALALRLEALLGNEEIAMEVTSPGTDRVIKNAAEFALFPGRQVKVWDREAADWILGAIAGTTDTAVVLAGENDQRTIPFEHIAKAKLG